MDGEASAIHGMIKDWADELHAKKTRIVFTNGVYDVLTPGHLQFLKWLCDNAETAADSPFQVVVGINADESVKALKGKHRPINTALQRRQMLEAIYLVDMVFVFHEPTPMKMIELLRPDILAKGGDYAGQQIVGQDFVLSYNGQVWIGPKIRDKSTTKTIEEIYRSEHPCTDCGGSGTIKRVMTLPGTPAGTGFDYNNPHDLTCVSCQGRGYV